MKLIPTAIVEVKIIEPQVFGDYRGYFYESFSNQRLIDHGVLEAWVQDNHSHSQKVGTLRGLHFQRNPHAQAKIVRCTRGGILDVAVDIRTGSPDYGKWVSAELTAENFRQLYVPAGFAHGFITLTDDAEVQYKASDYYAPDCDRGIRWDDPDIGIDWGISNPILSDKDRAAPLLRDVDNCFVWEGKV